MHNDIATTMKKKGTGRKKVEIKKIEKVQRRNVTFSKRRQGLFNKVKEISTLCGADIAVIVFSPTGKLYSYANTSVDSVVDRVVADGWNGEGSSSSSASGVRSGAGVDLSEWNVPIEDMGFQELLSYNDILQELKKKVGLGLMG